MRAAHNTAHGDRRPPRSKWEEQRADWFAQGQRPERRSHPVRWTSLDTRQSDMIVGTPSRRGAFEKPLPLSQVVDFLTEVWEDEGMYDRF